MESDKLYDDMLPFCSTPTGLLRYPSFFSQFDFLFDEKSSQIRTGEWHLDSDDKTERDFNVKNIIVHKLFNRPQRFANDIALLELSEDADLNGS